MTPEIMCQYLAAHAPELEVVELPEAHTTEYISREWKVLPAQVAKTLTLRVGEDAIIVVTCGDSRLDPRSYPNPAHSICPAHRRPVGRCLHRDVSQSRPAPNHTSL